MTEDRRQKTEDRRQKSEDRRQKTEDRRQKTEDRRQKTEDRRQKTEEQTCNICKSRLIFAFSYNDNYTFFRCPGCYYLKRVPDKLEIDYVGDYLSSEYLIKSKKLANNYFIRLKHHIEKGSKILEVGGSFGFLLNLIKTEQQCDVTNFELSENAANYSRTTNQIKTVSRFDESVIDGDYDAIICAHVIEHIAPSDMEGFIKNIFEKLKPGGKLILLTPNGMSDKINLLKKHYVWLAVPEHISFLSIKSAKLLLSQEGFEILQSSTEIPCFEHYPTNSILQYFIARVLRKESAAAGIKNDFKSNRSRLFIFLKSILRSLYFIEKIFVYPAYFIYDVFHKERDELVIIAKK